MAASRAHAPASPPHGLLRRTLALAQQRVLAAPRRLARQAVAAIGAELAQAQALVLAMPMPEAPRYLCGARMTYASALLPVRDGLGLSIAITRIDNRLIVSPTACRELMPEPEAFALAMRAEFEALRAAARRRRTTRPGASVRRSAAQGAAVAVRSLPISPTAPGQRRSPAAPRARAPRASKAVKASKASKVSSA